MRTDIDKEMIKDYLLNALSEEKRRLVELRMLSDEDFLDRVSLCEDDLIEDYLEGELSDTERQNFETSYLATAQGRHDLWMTRQLTETSLASEPIGPYAVSESV